MSGLGAASSVIRAAAIEAAREVAKDAATEAYENLQKEIGGTLQQMWVNAKGQVVPRMVTTKDARPVRRHSQATDVTGTSTYGSFTRENNDLDLPWMGSKYYKGPQVYAKRKK